MKRVFVDFNALMMDPVLLLKQRGGTDDASSEWSEFVEGEQVLLSDEDIETETRVFKHVSGRWAVRPEGKYRDATLPFPLESDQKID